MNKYKPKMIEREVVEIYCNKCGKFLQEAIPLDDGYFENKFEINEYNWTTSINIESKIEVVKPSMGSSLCPECKEKFIIKLGELVKLSENLYDEFNLRKSGED